MSATEALDAYINASGKAWKTLLDYRQMRASESQVAKANRDEMNALAALRLAIDDAHDEHCATCQCAGTVCNREVSCKRVWGHSGSCSTTRDEGFENR